MKDSARQIAPVIVMEPPLDEVLSDTVKSPATLTVTGLEPVVLLTIVAEEAPPAPTPRVPSLSVAASVAAIVTIPAATVPDVVREIPEPSFNWKEVAVPDNETVWLVLLEELDRV